MEKNKLKAKSRVLFLLMILLVLSSCSSVRPNVQATETAIAGSIFATWTAAAPLNTLAPFPTALPALTGTSTPWQTPTPLPKVRVKSSALNLREGPGTDFLSMELLDSNTSLIVIGQTGVCNWLKVIAPSGRKGWVSGGDFYVELTVPCSQIPEAAFRPLNGATLVDYRTYEGSGVLRISNPLNTDVVVILANMSRLPVIAYYLRSGEQYLVEELPESSYELFLDVGNDWLGDELIFAESVAKFRVIASFNLTSNNTELELIISTDSNEVSPAGDDFPLLKE